MEKIRDAHTGKLRKTTDLDKSRVRFNWGYHDGASDFLTKTVRPDKLSPYNIENNHFDAVYGNGYYLGWKDKEYNNYTEDSTKAWDTACWKFETCHPYNFK